MKRLAVLALVALGPATAAPADLWKKPASATDTLLPAEAAFQLASARREGDRVRLEWVIAPGYYLYRERLGFEVLPPSSATLGPARLPVGTPKHDEHFGDVQIYRETLQAELPITPAGAALGRLRVRFQGCADAGVCYPPLSREIALDGAVP